MGAAKCSGLGIRKCAKFASAALDDVARQRIGKRDRFGARARGIGENVKVGEGPGGDEFESGGVIGVGFAGKAGDYIGANGRVG